MESVVIYADAYDEYQDNADANASRAHACADDYAALYHPTQNHVHVDDGRHGRVNVRDKVLHACVRDRDLP